jgi:hypothetical protein
MPRQESDQLEQHKKSMARKTSDLEKFDPGIRDRNSSALSSQSAFFASIAPIMESNWKHNIVRGVSVGRAVDFRAFLLIADEIRTERTILDSHLSLPEL